MSCRPFLLYSWLREGSDFERRHSHKVVSLPQRCILGFIQELQHASPSNLFQNHSTYQPHNAPEPSTHSPSPKAQKTRQFPTNYESPSSPLMVPRNTNGNSSIDFISQPSNRNHPYPKSVFCSMPASGISGLWIYAARGKRGQAKPRRRNSRS